MLDREATATLVAVARSPAEDDLLRFWAAIDIVVVTEGAVDDVDVARALGIRRGMLPIDSEGEAGWDALTAQLAACHAVAQRGTSFAVRSTARRLLRSLSARDSSWQPWDGDLNTVVYVLAALYFVGAPIAWAILYRRWLERGKFTLRSFMVLTAILAFGLAIPTLFDAIVPLRFDDPDWERTRQYSSRYTANEAIPDAGISRLFEATE